MIKSLFSRITLLLSIRNTVNFAFFANLIVLGPTTGVSISKACSGFVPLINIPPEEIFEGPESFFL